MVGTISAETGEYEKECSRRNQKLPVRAPPSHVQKSVCDVKFTVNKRTKSSLHPATSLPDSHLSTCEPRHLHPRHALFQLPYLSTGTYLSRSSPQTPTFFTWKPESW